MSTPEHGELVRLVGLFNNRQFDEAEQAARALLQRHPGFGLGWKVLGSVLRQRGDATAALDCARSAVRLLPEDAEAHSNLGNVLRDLGRPQEALDSHRQALALKPAFAQGWNNHGNALRDLGRLAEAEASYRQTLALEPAHVQALGNLGLTLKDLQRPAQAQQVLQEAIRLHPDSTDLWWHLGATLNDLGQFQHAQSALQQCLQRVPDHAGALVQRAVGLRQLGQLAQARACLEQALAASPGLAEAHNSLGVVHNDSGLPDDAVASFRRALAQEPRHIGAQINLGLALTSLGHYGEGVELLQRAAQLRPDFREAHDNLLFALNYHPDLAPEDIFQAYQRYDQLFGTPGPAQYPAPASPRATPGRLRVGYVSPDFRRHSCRHFLLPLLSHHDRGDFELFAYAELPTEDDTTQAFRRHFDHWRSTWGVADEALARQIADDGIDILVDLAGHTAGNRLGVFAHQPAPVSVSWLGYGYTTGLHAIDHFLTDWPTVPAGSEPLFSESPWRLDRTALVFRPDDAMPPVAPLPAGRSGCVTFGAFTRAIRINRHTVRAWAAILARVPEARLVIDSRDLQSPALREQLLADFAALGVAPHRLTLTYQPGLWPLMQQVDIGLDCFPHNCGTTLFEALYMGLPVVTLAARPSVGRLGSAILQALGREAWIAHDEDSYIRIACALAADLPALAALRASLRPAMQASPLMDEADFTLQVENAYRAMRRARPA